MYNVYTIYVYVYVYVDRYSEGLSGPLKGLLGKPRTARVLVPEATPEDGLGSRGRSFGCRHGSHTWDCYHHGFLESIYIYI